MPNQRIYLSADGRPVKDVLENASQLRRWSLNVREDDALWEDRGLKDRLHLYSPQQVKGEFLESTSDRYVVQRGKDKKVGVYDVQMGRRVEDAWLEEAASDFFDRSDLRIAWQFLTDDLKYIVVFPRDVRGNDQFIVGGKSYSKGGYGVIYERGVRGPVVFSGMRHEMPFSLPFKCFSDHGDLRFCGYTETSLSLSDREGNMIASTTFPQPKKWLAEVGVRFRYDETNDSVSMIQTPQLRSVPDEESVHESMEVLIWRIKDSRVASYSVPTTPWFEHREGGFYPVTVKELKHIDPTIFP